MLNNQGLAKREFRAALGFIRLAESSLHRHRLLPTPASSRARASRLMPSIVPEPAHRRADRRAG